jgi:hypothetical protein
MAKIEFMSSRSLTQRDAVVLLLSLSPLEQSPKQTAAGLAVVFFLATAAKADSTTGTYIL